MKVESLWSERLPSKDSFAPTITSLAFSPIAPYHLLIGSGSRILVYDSDTGDLLHSLKGHKDYVYAVAYSRDGKRFASGGADKTIIIWTNKCDGILKYSHGESIQCLAYNPITQQLASGTSIDFGLWSPEQKSVAKHKVSAKVTCLAWTNDGQYIALGQVNGQISIRDKQGVEKVRIERSESIWSLAWSPPTTAPTSLASGESIESLLCVGCWDQTLSFYELNGQQYNKDRRLDYDPLSVCYFGDGEYILVTGSNSKCSLYTKDGVFLRTICERGSWIWSAACRPKSKTIALGTELGEVSAWQGIFSTVHGLYADRYAHRDTMTDVIIQHLMTDQKVRIKTRDYVKKIAVYKNRLAIQLPDRILIYETDPNVSVDSTDMHYRLAQKIVAQLDCNLLVVTCHHIILCQERQLQLYSFSGQKQREWSLDAVIRYIRVVGGPARREGLLVGLKNGCVYKIFVDNPWPVRLIQHSAPIRCLDLSVSRQRLAVVDENSKIFIYQLHSAAPSQSEDVTQQQSSDASASLAAAAQEGEIIFEEQNANSVAWNTEMEEMFCFSGGGQLCIKTGVSAASSSLSFPLHKQALQGFVVGFKGSKIFCLHYLAMQTIDVPQSASMHRYLDIADYDSAYRVACLGVTDADWRALASKALLGLHFTIARQAFIRVRDIRYIELLNRIETARRSASSSGHKIDDALYLADIHAFQGHFPEAAQLYIQAGSRKRAIEMYLDLRDWDKARELAEQESTLGSGGVSSEGSSLGMMNDLMKRQAVWLYETNDMSSAAEMYWSIKDYKQCLTILGDRGWLDQLMTKARLLMQMSESQLAVQQQKDLVSLAASYFKRYNHHAYARECFTLLGDIAALLSIHVANHKWDDAFALLRAQIQNSPEMTRYNALVYEPYAEWLATQDRFDECQVAFERAGRPSQSLAILHALIGNSLLQHHYADTARYYWLLAAEQLKQLSQSSGGGAGATASKDAAAKSSTAASDAKSTGLSGATSAATLTDAERRTAFTQCHQLAMLYSAYDVVYRYINEPFTSTNRDTIFAAAQFILNSMCEQGSLALAAASHNAQLIGTSTESSNSTALTVSASKGASASSTTTHAAALPASLSLIACLYALAKQAHALGAFKLARDTYTRLLQLSLSPAQQHECEVAALLVRARPYSDNVSLLPVCYTCSQTNPLLGASGELCCNCGARQRRSMQGWETLPLVEFKIAADITADEAEKLIRTKPLKQPSSPKSKENEDQQSNTLSFGDDASSASPDTDQFASQLMALEPSPLDKKYPSIVLDRVGLAQLNPAEVFITRWRGCEHQLPTRYAKSVIPDIGLQQCSVCQNIALEDEFDFYLLQHHCCPFCRSKMTTAGGAAKAEITTAAAAPA